jgi:hypothetical protein
MKNQRLSSNAGADALEGCELLIIHLEETLRPIAQRQVDITSPIGRVGHTSSRPPLPVHHRSRRAFIQVELCADVLQAGNKRINLLLLPRNNRVLFLPVAVLLQEFIE